MMQTSPKWEKQTITLETGSSPDREMQDRIGDLRRQVWHNQNPVTKLTALKDKTFEYAKTAFASENGAREQILGAVGSIFEHQNPADLLLRVPQRITGMLSLKPCTFTMLAGLGTHESLALGDVGLVPRYNTVASRHQVQLETEFTRGLQISAPIVVSNMRSAISEKMADIMIEMGLTPIFHRFRRPLNELDCDKRNPTVQTQEAADAEKIMWANKYGEKAFFSCGVRPANIEFTKKLIELGVGGICLDVAHANSESAVATVLQLKDFIRAGGYSTKIIAGNVDTDEGYLLLALAGADCVKVGIGPGSACTTRKTTGAGNGQASALMEVAIAKFVLGDEAPPFIADGGIEDSNGVLISLALGASSVMIGKIAACCEESGALKRRNGDNSEVWYFGEASKWAREYEAGSVKKGMGVEGKGNWLRQTGTFENAVDGLLGGLRNSFPYYNAANIPALQRKFSPPHQLCELILGGTTGIKKISAGFPAEAGTRLT